MAKNEKITIEFSKREIKTISNAILNFALPAYAQDLRNYNLKLKKWDGKEKTKPKMPITFDADNARDIANFLKRQL